MNQLRQRGDGESLLGTYMEEDHASRSEVSGEGYGCEFAPSRAFALALPASATHVVCTEVYTQRQSGRLLQRSDRSDAGMFRLCSPKRFS